MALKQEGFRAASGEAFQTSDSSVWKQDDVGTNSSRVAGDPLPQTTHPRTWPDAGSPADTSVPLTHLRNHARQMDPPLLISRARATDSDWVLLRRPVLVLPVVRPRFEPPRGRRSPSTPRSRSWRATGVRSSEPRPGLLAHRAEPVPRAGEWAVLRSGRRPTFDERKAFPDDRKVRSISQR